MVLTHKAKGSKKKGLNDAQRQAPDSSYINTHSPSIQSQALPIPRNNMLYRGLLTYLPPETALQLCTPS